MFTGAGDLVEDTWWPRIDAVEMVLSFWHSRSLSLRGKPGALVINDQALSRIWYVASVVHKPPRVMHEHNCFGVEISSFFFSFGVERRILFPVLSLSSLPFFRGGGGGGEEEVFFVGVKLKVWSHLAQ